MNKYKYLTIIVLKLFLLSFYLLPMAEAVTLGDIRDHESRKETDGHVERKIPALKDENIKRKRADKNPRLVCLLSVLMPGGGHFYLNNDSKGMGFCLAAGVGYTATGYFMVKTLLAEVGTTEFKNYLLLSGFLFFITLIVHFVGIIEAYDDADEMSRAKMFGRRDSDNPFSTDVVFK